MTEFSVIMATYKAVSYTHLDVYKRQVYGIPDEKKEYITEKDLGYIELENVRSSYRCV